MEKHYSKREITIMLNSVFGMPTEANAKPDKDEYSKIASSIRDECSKTARSIRKYLKADISVGGNHRNGKAQ